MQNNTQIMGILNLTPDSFFDGGTYNKTKKALTQTEKMLSEGADIIDIGAYSSRPNAVHISQKEELSRLIPIVKEIVKEFPKAQLSIDTFRAEVAKQGILEGAHIINDISGGNMDAGMFATIAKLQVPYILMHMQGIPQQMQNNPSYTDVTMTVFSFFQKKIQELQELGVNNVTLDVGFGFGKTLAQNYELLRNLKKFKKLNQPILVGVSRKSMLYNLLDSTPSNMLNATTVANTIAVLNGANILRVHDVKEAVEVVQITKQLESKPPQ